MTRPVEPGFTASQARVFREKFRACREALRATNADIGTALDKYAAKHAKALGGRGDGTRAVTSALARARVKLTHRTARRLVVGLFLSEPARQSEHEPKCFKREKGGFNELADLLYGFGAWRDARRELPVFIPLDVADKFAEWLAAAAVEHGNGIGDGKRAVLARALRQSLRAQAPLMARSWCDVALKTRVARKPGAPDVIEGLAQIGFGDRSIPPGRESSSFGPELAVLHRERPELTQGMILPQTSGEDRKRMADALKKTIAAAQSNVVIRLRKRSKS